MILIVYTSNVYVTIFSCQFLFARVDEEIGQFLCDVHVYIC